MKTTRKYRDLEYKQKIVAEFESGRSSADAIADREGLECGQIYKWRTQLENRARGKRIEKLETSGLSKAETLRTLELEDELTAAKEKIADQALAIDLLKKIHPSYQSEKKSS